MEHHSGDTAAAERAARSGFLAAFSAYFIWGVMPFYWKLLDHVSPVETLAHRALWAVPFAAVVLVFMGRTGDILPTLKSPRKVMVLLLCSLLVSANWGVFIWAVTVDRILETALAYYINPLISVFLGFVFLGDRFNRLQMVAIIIAALAVLLLTVLSGSFPWLSVFLALTFAFYGLLRKTVDVGPAQGFLIETLLVSFIALVYVVWPATSGKGNFLGTIPDTILLLLAGPATAIPLILFATGAKRLRLSTIGLMQFMVPTMLFLSSIFVFGEPLKQSLLIAFVMIWVALALYAWSLLRIRQSA